MARGFSSSRYYGDKGKYKSICGQWQAVAGSMTDFELD
jgi:hypothetical protein